MKRRYLIISFAIISILFYSFIQTDNGRVVPNHSFSVGERVEYRVHYGFINAAEAKVDIAKNLSTVSNRPCYRINVTGKTVGAFDMISRVRDTWRSYVDTSAILPLMFQRSIQENKYRKDETVLFNHSRDIAYSTIKNETKSYPVPNNVHDLISGYFYLRTINFNNFNEGDIIEMPTFFDGKIYKLKIKYLGKDVISTKFGKTKVIRLNPLIPDNKFFRGENPMKLWVSDDDNKIPLKAEVELVIGSLEMDIKAYKGLQKDINWM